MDQRAYQNTYGYQPDYLYADSCSTNTVYSPSAPPMSRGHSSESKLSTSTYNDTLSPVTPVLMTDNIEYYSTPYGDYNVDGTDASSGLCGNEGIPLSQDDMPLPQDDMAMYPANDWSMTYTTSPLAAGEMTIPFGDDIPYMDPESEPWEAPPETNGSYVCLHGGCESKPFKRKADLERHIKHVHVADEDKEKFYCDYQKCQRSGDAFHRIDHCRDHYRDYHLEDLARRKGESDDWYRQRKNVPKSWWRCTRCLNRIRVEKYGFECPTCRVPCDKKRQRLRSH